MSIGDLHAVQMSHLRNGKILNTQHTAIQLFHSPTEKCAVHAGRESATLINMGIKHLYMVVCFVCFCLIL